MAWEQAGMVEDRRRRKVGQWGYEGYRGREQAEECGKHSNVWDVGIDGVHGETGSVKDTWIVYDG